ncbi:Fe(3+) dicitrate ABC transporter ATP-binding protein FecE [Marinobacterium arenosum]|uniref:Fe(3+) dicitrate ABC transporter ATP-binding protein FecE n=1 Tax=Marinobacterium arenosum TaxID=2862496 RepID=UPI001C93B6C8|nr:Fe(3+) dicitrate ABC transporter ATP-binding protein FecE [Marinobacterium arenosum]MBY4677353.1 Fe(3+) dicitrate ABC transporter ATP-binding protein FecE [Marinobacterium arenosum]
MAYLSIENLQVGYADRVILPQLSLQIPQGKISALIGPNGCGKSTLLKTIARILAPTQGRVLLQGDDLHRLDTRAVARRLALLPQAPITPDGVSCRELVGYGRAPWRSRWGRLSAEDRRLVDEALQQVGLAEFADRPLAALSGGQRQRAWIAMTLAQQTDLILLDEPTTWLDIAHQIELLTLLRQLNQAGKTIVLVLHDLNQACRYCDQLVVLRDGQLQAQGTPQQVFTAGLVQQVFDLPAEIHPDPVAGTPQLVPV